MQHQNVIMIS